MLFGVSFDFPLNSPSIDTQPLEIALLNKDKTAIKRLIDEALVAEKQCDEANYDKDQYSNPARRRLVLLNASLALLEKDVSEVELYQTGMLLVNGRYVIAPQSGKWRVLGKGKWYWYKTVMDMVDRYINKGNYYVR